ncbi:hypothetical protein MD484_g6421, partial [Candolleomyces efflorescens]
MGGYKPIDDDSSYIAYSGSWELIRGSTRQWGGGTVHSTAQVGATATFRFRGTQVRVVATIPSGPGSSRSQYRIDGGSATSALRDGEHTLVITNVGNSADYRLDKIEWVASDGYPETPLPPLPPAPSSTPITTQPAPSNNIQSSQPVSQPQPSAPSSQPPPITTVVTQVSDSGVTSVITSVVTPAITSVSSGSTGIVGGSSSSGAGSTGGTRTTLGSNGETLIVKEVVSSTVTTRDPANTDSGVDATGATGGFKLSTGALVGIIVGSLILLFVLLILLFVLFRRYRKRRALLSKPLNDGAWAPGQHTREIRAGGTNLTPFDIAAQRTSAFLAGGAFGNNDRNMGAFTRLDDNAHPGPSALSPVHKSALNDLRIPYSPAGASSSNSPASPSDSSQYTNTLLPSDAGRNTADLEDPTGQHNAVPPPSYQASTLLNAGSVESGSFFSAQGSSALGSSKSRMDGS